MRARPALFDLLGLQRDLLIGRWRRACRGPADAAGLAFGGLGVALSSMVLLLAALLFGYVGRTLLVSLLASGRAEMAGRVVGLFADGGLIVALAAVALADPRRAGSERGPLAVLPVSRTDRALAEIAGLLLFHPLALVIWPVALALLSAGRVVSNGAALLLAPAAAGLLLLTAAACAALRGALAALAGSGRGFRALGVRALVLVAPLGWLLLVRDALDGGAEGASLTAIPSPGRVVAFALESAIDGNRLAALAWGTLLAAAAGLTLAWAAGTTPKIPAGNGATRQGVRRGGAGELRRVWGPSRAGILAGQGVAGAAVVLLIGTVAASRLGGAWSVIAPSGAFAAWLLFSSIAPLSANALGLGAPATAGDALLPERAARALWRVQVRILAPIVIAGAGVAGAAAALGGSPASGLVILSLVVGLAAVTGGAGSLCSVLWPWPLGSGDDTDPAWAPGPSRVVMTLAHGLVLAVGLPVLLEAGTDGVLAVLSPCAAGVALGGANFAVAARRLERRRWDVTEALLR